MIPFVKRWQDDAACAEVGGDFWFPEVGNSRAVAAARAICADCPVRVECLRAALDNGESFGIWGGLDLIERRRVRA